MTRRPAPRVRTLWAAGARLLRRYTGTLAALYLVQVLLSGLVYFVTAVSLSSALSNRPLFDRGVSGDLIALAHSLSAHTDLLSGLALLGVGVVALYLLVSWYLAAGAIGVLCHRPYGRRDVIQRFGDSGGISFLPFARLALWSVLPWVLVLITAGIGISVSGAGDALYPEDLFFSLGPALMPAAFLALWLSTVIAYARVQIVRQPGLASWRAFVHASKLVSSRPRLLLHAATYPLLFIALTFGYVLLTHDRAVFDGGTALALWFVRQMTVALRLALKVWILGGQVEAAKELVDTR